MNILGISCYYHDAAASLVIDGHIVSSAAEERFSRINHDESFPKNAIEFCLKSNGLSANDLDFVVFYEKPFKKLHRIILSTLSGYPKTFSVFHDAMRVWAAHKLWIKEDIASHLRISRDKILFTQHHESHAGSCFFPSPFEESVILTVDGVGEWTAATGIGRKNTIMLKKELQYPHSIGLLYSAFTAFLGFAVNSDEGKVMGLAPYGKPRYVENIWKLVRQNKDTSIELDLSYFAFPYSTTHTFNDKFVRLFGTPIKPSDSHIVVDFNADIASSIQVVTEQIVLAMAKKLKNDTKLDAICLAGGVFLNSVINWKIYKESGFKHVWVQPGAGDAGAAIGAALYVYHQTLGNKKRFPLEHAYLGAESNEHAIKKFIREKNIKATRYNDGTIIEKTVDSLVKHKIIGWMQGKFEHGPRALGNRSILADPQPWWMEDVVNTKIKYREGFRPFAPSVLAEKFKLALDIDGDVLSNHPLRYMLYVVPVKKSWREKIAAVNHVDNTARPQIVIKETNPRYHSLINTFYQATGVPMVLNTSFNLKGEPIVNTPEDAYKTFMRSGMDALVLGNWWVEKK